MMRTLVVLLCAVLLPVAAMAGEVADAAGAETPLKWRQLTDMPTGVLAAAISRVGDDVVITGGIHQFGSALHKGQVYSLREKKWKMPVEMVVGRTMHAQVTLDDRRILLAGGQTGTVKPLGKGLEATASCEIIDIRTGRSMEIAPLPRPVEEPTAHLLPDGRAIVIGGESALIFDPKTNKWGKGIGLREDRQAHASAVLSDGRVIVVGGLHRQSIEVIDPVGGASKMLSAELPHTLDDTRIAVLPGDGKRGDRVWVIGGQHSKTGLTVEQTWIIDLSDPNRSSIAAGPNLEVLHGVADFSLVRVGHYLVIVGGESEFNGGDVELKIARALDTRTLKVHKLPDTEHPHDDAVAIASEGGVLIFGGFVETKLALPVGGTTKTVSVPQAVSAVEQLLLPDDDQLK